ncbi:hypothetical protein CN481_04825 [Bacillus sp. AFS006103]|nr:hypothetical protein CN481_04825 [Bacillus sp. AFS006103]
MGSLEHIEQLEAHIDDLGKEIKRVKKASDYLKLIEQFQSEIKNTSSTLSQSRDQLKIYQEVMEGKLGLYQTLTKNIDSKQQLLEQHQLSMLESLGEVKKQQEKDVKGITLSLNDVNKVVNQNHRALMEEIKRGHDAQSSLLQGMTKTNKAFFAINLTLIILVCALLVIK